MRVEPARSPTIEEERFYPAPPRDEPRPRVLLADDHPGMIDAESAILSAHFDVVGTAVDGAALLAEARSLHPDVIVTDISLPIVNGIEAVRKIRESGSTAQFVFLTALREKEFVDACMEAGALGYVQKSRMNQDLMPAMLAALAGKSYVSKLSPTW
jgi:DNA-binding NarL/FixJ family response regulator